MMIPDFTAARTNMVENQVRTNDVTDLPVQDAMRVVERERLCPPGKAYLAYAETYVEYAPGWFLMQPREVSKLLQAVFPKPGERALAIAAPYAAAVLARMDVRVTLLQPLGAAYDAACRSLADQAVAVRCGDLTAAADLAPDATPPYDIIICEGAVPVVPATWLAALDVGGRLGVAERSGPVGKARLYLRSDDGLTSRRELFDCSPPMMPGFEAAEGFVF